MSQATAAPLKPPELTLPLAGRLLVLLAAFGGWMGAGFQMGIYPLIVRDSAPALIHPRVEQPPESLKMEKEGRIVTDPATRLKMAREAEVGWWFGWFNAAFLLGAAGGGLVFGWIGDLIGRVKSMGLSILCYSSVTGLTYFTDTPEQLFILRFFVGLGVGGMWPTGVALCGEAWSEVSRPMLAGLIGTAANVGITAVALIAKQWHVTPETWRWLLVWGATPAIIGVFALLFVPESRAWLAARGQLRDGAKRQSPVRIVFRPPLLRHTLIGIALGAIPLLGGWALSQWVIPWGDQVHESDKGFKASISMARSGGAIIGSLFGGWIASLVGRRTTYFVIALLSFGISVYLFGALDPSMGFSEDVALSLHQWTLGFIPKVGGVFWTWVFILGLISTVFFGWLPLYLPELFPTAVRATGSGVTFNFGRILAAAGALVSGQLLLSLGGEYGPAGVRMSVIYAVGMLVVLFAPDTTKPLPALPPPEK